MFIVFLPPPLVAEGTVLIAVCLSTPICLSVSSIAQRIFVKFEA